MEGQRIRVDFDVSAFDIRYQYSRSTPAIILGIVNTKLKRAYLSVAMFNFAIEVKSSVLFAAVLVKGVPIGLPAVTEPLGVEVEVVASPPLSLDDCFAAFSARRFCFEEEGGMTRTSKHGLQSMPKKLSVSEF
jgi:hypothetical protein